MVESGLVAALKECMQRLGFVMAHRSVTDLCAFVWLQRLQAKVLKLVDISYGGENGFNQAIELSAEVLSNVKFIQEKKLIGTYSDCSQAWVGVFFFFFFFQSNMMY